MYSRDPAGTRFSPLTQINAENVSTLTQVWTVRVTPPPRGRGRGGAARLRRPQPVGRPAARPRRRGRCGRTGGAGERGALPAGPGGR